MLIMVFSMLFTYQEETYLQQVNIRTRRHTPLLSPARFPVRGRVHRATRGSNSQAYKHIGNRPGGIRIHESPRTVREKK